jgi:hypothetical protein
VQSIDDGLSVALFVTVALTTAEFLETRNESRSGTQCMSVTGTREFICIALVLARARAQHTRTGGIALYATPVQYIQAHSS